MAKKKKASRASRPSDRPKSLGRPRSKPIDGDDYVPPETPTAPKLLKCRTGPFRFVKVEHRVGEKYALLVTIDFNQTIIELPCHAADVQSFVSFQRRAAELCGLWLVHWSQMEHREQNRREAWLAEVADAFEAGARK